MSDAEFNDLKAAIERTQLERERLHDLGASRRMLERNRLQLVRLQWELSYALIERYGHVARQAA